MHYNTACLFLLSYHIFTHFTIAFLRVFPDTVTSRDSGFYRCPFLLMAAFCLPAASTALASSMSTFILYAVCTDLLDEPVKDILRASEDRWQSEDCFRTMKTDFSARPVYVQRKARITAHFLTCFLALLVYRMLEKNWGKSIHVKKFLEH